jgi:hypothetical protein
MGHLVINEGGTALYYNGAAFVANRKSRVLLTAREVSNVELDYWQHGKVRFVRELDL